ncbi:hypothetical protein TKK_0011722 [Trichogramma kaykai]
MERRTGDNFVILCPGQGHPIPTFSFCFFIDFGMILYLLCKEPVGSKSPSVMGDTKRWMRAKGGQTFEIPCQAQGHPVPAFSYLLYPVTRQFRSMKKFLEPIGVKAPNFSTDDRSSSFIRAINESLTLQCPAQEPTSNVAPRLAGERYEGGRLVSVATGRVIALLCAVQGSPAPIQRWYKFIEGTSRRQPVQLNERVRQVSGTLIILEAQVDDSGKYLCVVNNSVGGESVETVLTVTAPLAAEIEPRSQTIDFGRPATFTCNTKGNPIKTVSWLKDGKPIGHEDTTLKIESVKKDDKGMYQCFIRNDQESAQASAELKLGGRFEPPQIRSAFHEETLQPGPSVHLKCTASGNPTPEITWELDGKKLSNTERFQVGQYVTVNGDVVSNLNISSIHTNDGGLYKCIASSKVGSAEHSARLNVYGLPFIRHMDKKAIVAGETLRVTCPVAGHPIESIVWERDTRVLPINRKQKVFQNGTLIIENVERMTDQATYTCVARNAQGYSARGTLEVQVMESPHIQPFTFTKVPMNAGDFANLQCIVPIGDLPLKIRWHYPGEKLGGASSVMVKKVADRVSMLMIPTITEKHAGDYVCQAENAAGSVEHRASLVVNVAPQLLPIAFNAETANEGDMVSVACSILKGDAPLNISWSFNGTTMEDDPLTGVTINRINKYLSTLSIESVAARHAGEYACRAQNLAGAVSHTTFLAVNVAPQILPFTFGDEPANWADLMSITCSVVKGDLPIDIGWAFNGEPLTEARNAELGVLVASTNRKNSVLSIESVQAKHVGEYACLATNRAGTATHAAHLAVNVLPQILEFSFGEAPLNSGEMLSLSCTIVKGDLPVHFTWLFDGRPVLDRSESNDLALVQPQLNVVTTPRVSFLSVDSVEARHAGSYTCLANNSAGHDSHTANLVVNVAPQIVPFEIADEPVNSGDSISVVCALVKGDLPIDISWSVDGQPVAEKHADVAVLATTKKNSILSIESVAARHAGVYTCSAANKAGAVSHSSILKVNVSPQIVPFTFGDAGPVNSGEAVSSVCTVSRGDQPLEFNWYLNGQLVDPEQRPGLQILTSKRRSLLEIEAVQASDAGEYTCSVSNQAGATSHSSVLAVNVIPQIVAFSFGDRPANSGESMSATCSVSAGDHPLKFSWFFNGEKIAPANDQEISIFTKKRRSWLEIESVSAQHAGEYTCSVVNPAGSAKYSTTLVVNVGPQIGSFSFGDEPLNAGDATSLTCSVTKGDSPLEIVWMFKSEPIDSANHGDVIVTQTGKRTKQLSIDSVNARHAGEYTCVASNVAGSTSRSAVLSVNVSPQITPFTAGDGPVSYGETISMTCTVSRGDQPLEFFWYFNGEQIKTAERQDLTVSINKRRSILEIESVGANHAGEYTCTVSNEAGATSHSTVLAVNVSPQITPFTAGDGPVSYGESISIICAVSRGDQPLEFFWYFKGQQIIAAERQDLTIAINKRRSILEIESVSASHAGEYTCTVSNEAGATSHSTVLAVNVSPQIAPFTLSDEPVNYGESVSVICAVSKGDQPLEFFWYFNGEQIKERQDISIVINKRRSILEIESVSASHAGEYTCTVSNEAGATSHSTHLAVNVSPQITPFTLGDEPVNYGESISITCGVSKGDQPLEFHWYFKGDQILAAERPDLSISTNKRRSILEIDSVSAKHAGEYTCTVSNDAGATSHSTTLAINVSPQIAPFSLGDEPVSYGEAVSIACAVSKGDMPLQFQWYFKGQQIIATERQDLSISINKRRSNLEIESVGAHHAGEYTCTVSNEAGATSHSTNLAVNVSPQIAPFSLGDEPVSYGEAVSITCAVSKGDMPLQFQWYFKGQQIIAAERQDLSISINKRRSNLEIESVGAHHAGEYTCTVSNEAGATSHSTNLAVNVSPQIAPFSLGDEPVNYGEAVSITCAVSKGDQPLEFFWYLNGQLVDSEKRPGLQILTSKRRSLLEIEAVQASDAGEYTCTVSNEAGATSHSTNLAVNVSPQITPFTLGDEPVNYGESISMTCGVSRGDQPLEFYWYFKGQQIVAADRQDLSIVVNKRRSILEIESVGAHHAGEYTCTVSNEAGATSYSANLAVNVSPQIVPFTLGDEAVNYGDSVSLACAVSRGDQPLEFHWFLNGEEISASARQDLTVIVNKRRSNLEIESVSADHSGEYTCTVSNEAGTTSHSTSLAVNVSPQIVPFTLGDGPVNSGESISTICTISRGDQPLEFHWFFRGEPIDDDRQSLSITKSKRRSILEIESVSASHAGEYTCTVSNEAGATSYSANLAVNVPPQVGPVSLGDEPVNWGEQVSATCNVLKGDAPIDIHWTLNGQPIDEAHHPDLRVSMSGKKLSLLIIDSVAAHHAGEYTCVAKNRAGSSSRSTILAVNVAPQIVPFSFSDRPANSGESMSATCSVSTGDFPLAITWYFDGQKLTESLLDDVVISTSKRRSLLEIESVGAHHAGSYKCSVENDAGTATHTAVLIVNAAPQIVPFSFADRAVNSGESISATCSVSVGDNPLEFSWFFNGEPIDTTARPDISITYNKRRSALDIESVTADNSGEYTCTVSNKAGATSHSTALVVNAPPQIAPFTMGLEAANWGEQISATCSVLKGDNPIEIQWSLNGRIINEADHPDIVITKSGRKISLLVIDSVKAHHAGEYICTASNLAGSSSHSAVLSVNVAPQIGSFSFGDEPLNAGETASLTCIVAKGDFPLEIIWMFNGAPIDPNVKEIIVSETGKRTKQLTIDSVGAQHAGEYTCVASNVAGSTTRSAALVVNVAPQIGIGFTFGEEPLNAGDMATVTCAVIKGDSPLDIGIMFDGKPIEEQENSGILIANSGKRAKQLTIEAVEARHAGEYTCVASNLAGATSRSALLAVNVPPQITPFSIDEGPVNWGEQVSLFCSVLKGDRPMKIHWQLNGEIIDPKKSHVDGVAITKTGKMISVLSIDSVAAHHAGNYSCVASNAAGQAQLTTRLSVNVAPQIKTFSFGDEPLNAGETTSIQCVITKGDFPLDISFMFKGSPIVPGGDTIISETGKRAKQLMIDSVSARHVGEYTCVASNVAGSTSHSAYLEVNVPPQIGTFSFGEEPLNAGDTASVQCVVMKGDFPLDISFTFQGKPVESDDGIVVSVTGKRAKQLMLDSVSAKHAGEYTCIASNVAGTTTRSTLLAVNVAPQIGMFSFGDEPLNAGDMASVQCAVMKGDFPLDISFMFKNEPIVSSDEVVITENGKRIKQLMIDSANARHAGEYTCIASNVAGSTSRSAILAVNVPPQIGSFSFGTGAESLNAGDIASVTCAVTKGDLPMDIQWMFQNQPIDVTREDVVVTNLGKRGKQLSIESVGAEHAGEYTCVASNVAGATTRTAVLEVNVSPQIGAFTFGTEPVNAGDVASVTCVVTKGDFPMDIQWMFQNQPIGTEREDIMVSNFGKRGKQLTIESVGARHAGEYTCVASNVAGSTTRTAVLDVNVAPQIGAFTFGTEPINAGDVASVTCVVIKGDFPMEIQWMFKSQPIDVKREDIVISNVGKRGKQLSIESVGASHAGEYTCVASNVAGSTSRSAVLDVNVAPQISAISFGDEPVNAGDIVSVLCTVTKGDFPLEIQWMFKGQPLLPTAGDVVISDSGKRGKQLTIEAVRAEHMGEYTCVASNVAGSTTRSAVLDVNVLPRLLPFSLGDGPLNSGQVVTVPCAVVEGDVPLKLSWTLNGQPISPHSGISVLDLGERGAILSIGSVQASHAGNYTCTAENPAGKHELSAELIVNVHPRIVPFDFGNEQIYAGQTAQLACMVQVGDTPIDIYWTYEGRRLRPESEAGLRVGQVGPRTSVLSIDPVESSHGGGYACVASNASGNDTHRATLRVHVPPRWILEPTDKAFAQGSDARVECKADGFPKPQVTWKKAAGDTPGDYTDLKMNNADISVEDGTLMINNIQKTNEGYYLCEAVNGIGSGLSAVILISVQAPPHFEIKLRNQTARRGEPAVLQCEAQGEKPIGILWNMNNKRLDPKSDSRYTIREEIMANGVLSDLSIKRTERTDSALFTCVATNAFGSDDTSINMIVQEVPEVPYGLKVLDKSGRSVQLSWAAPYDGNSPIKRYVIEYKISKGSWEADIDRVVVPSSQQNVAGVFNLKPATTYHLRIVAENEIGTSEPSDTVTIITAEEAPSGPPSSVRVDALDQHTLKVSWKPPPRDDWNGEILGYYVGNRLASSDKPYMFETVEFSKEDGKEHHLQIMNLKTYTQYSVVVQAFNKVGSGPMSEERRQHTAEGVPEQPPHDTTCTTLTSQTIRVSWSSPPLAAANGVITGYKIIYGPSESWQDENTKDTKITSSSETILHGLKKFTNYSMQILAFTSGGDGVKSAPIHCQTEQDAPEAPTAIKALVMSASAILVSWRPPSQPNGVISQYTVYWKGNASEQPSSQKVSPTQLTHEVSSLEETRKYDFWVTASTNIGEGQPSKVVNLAPSASIPAKIASFDDKFVATYKEDVKLPCLAVGVPAPEVTWKVRGVKLAPTDRLRQLPEGSLFIKEVDRTDAGEYSCYVENTFGHDTVTHQLVVHAPPHSPQVTLTATTTNSLTMKLRPHQNDNAPIHGYTIHYKPEFGDWETVQISSTSSKYTLENLWCGSRYQIYVTAYNTIGMGEPSDILNTRTKGSKPIIPEASRFIEVSTKSITLHLHAWSDGGCPIIYFVVEHKKKHSQEWNQVSNNVKPGGNFVVMDLDAATWYHLRVTANNNPGSAVAEYEFATLTVTGSTIAPARELPDLNASDSSDDPMKIFMANLNLVVPVVAAVLVIIVAVIVICVLKGKAHDDEKGASADNDRDMEDGDVRRFFPWLPMWLDINVVVPVGATVVVIIVGIVVICVALSRRTRGPEQTRLRGISASDEKYYEGQYDVVYQQTGPIGATLDKRRPDLRDELGYIAPPNRKLPPVPGSNYNTCDRIKRGTVISMEDEICPYATFHLLGFREEMDPSKAMQFQTFPHPVNGHTATMGPAVGHPNNSSAHSRSGSQSMPRQANGGRYSRVPSQGGSTGGNQNIFTPEYDDPANCNPEEDYGSQYGQYGAPYDHYGSRGSVGRRSVGSLRNLPVSNSPEPPPPPPRNHDQSNSSFNDSKESTDVNDQDDRDQLIRNYGETKAQNKAPSAATTQDSSHPTILWQCNL